VSFECLKHFYPPINLTTLETGAIITLFYRWGNRLLIVQSGQGDTSVNCGLELQCLKQKFRLLLCKWIGFLFLSFFTFLFLFLLVETKTCFVTQAGLKLMILLPLFPEHWDYRYAPPSPVQWAGFLWLHKSMQVLQPLNDHKFCSANMFIWL
jgi:hypothetical protein